MIYVAEIFPPVKSTVEAFTNEYVSDERETNNDIEMDPLYGFIQRACFYGLSKDIKYTIKVRTIVNGRTICQVSQEIEY